MSLDDKHHQQQLGKRGFDDPSQIPTSVAIAGPLKKDILSNEKEFSSVDTCGSNTKRNNNPYSEISRTTTKHTLEVGMLPSSSYLEDGSAIVDGQYVEARDDEDEFGGDHDAGDIESKTPFYSMETSIGVVTEDYSIVQGDSGICMQQHEQSGVYSITRLFSGTSNISNSSSHKYSKLLTNENLYEDSIEGLANYNPESPTISNCLKAISEDFTPKGDQKILRAIGRTAIVNAAILLTTKLNQGQVLPLVGYVTGGIITFKRLAYDGFYQNDKREMGKALAVYACATSASITGQTVAGAVLSSFGGVDNGNLLSSSPFGSALIFGVGCCSGISAGALSEWMVDRCFSGNG